MKISEFLKEKILYLIMELAAIIFTFAVLNIHNISLYSIFYIIVIMITAFTIPMICEYMKKRVFYNNLRNIITQLDRKFLLSEMIEEPDFLEGEILYDALKSSNKSMNDEIAKYKSATNDYRDYIEKWVHDIKTPIAACKLTIENYHDKNYEQLAEDLDKIDNYVMQTLFYSRMSNVEKDYSIKEVTLNKLISSSLRANSRTLIRNGFSIEMDNLDITVLSDEKWTGFILEQIISNSVKYKTENPVLRFEGSEDENSVMLKISDNGIGIAPCDLPRIFEKNFTGGNGRLNKKSTGFGLYLCKKLCTRLGIDISAQSENGTVISLCFPKGQAKIMKYR